MPLPFLLFVVFVFGAVIGSFLNVCIYRLPLEKSLLWPGSRCGHCLQPIRWYDNLPLLSFWWLRGRCRTCGQRFSTRYFLIELLTACCFVGLFYLEVVENVHHLNAIVLKGRGLAIGPWVASAFDVGLWAIFAYHAILVCFLLVASFCDIDGQIIPLPLTVTGTVVGLAGSVLFPWPWPYLPREAAPILAKVGGTLTEAPMEIPEGVYSWPVWGPLPSWLHPGGNWQTGLATGLTGLIAGTLMLRLVRLFFGLGGGSDYMEPLDPELETPPKRLGSRVLSWFQRVGGKALGLGDADLMMLAGSFLGWQPTVAGFFIAVFPGLIIGVAQKLGRGENALPFGPALAIGVVVSFLGWHWIGRHYQLLFFNGPFMILVAGMGCVGLILAAYSLRLVKLMRH